MLRRAAPKVVGIMGLILLVAVLGVVGKAWWESRLPGTYSVMSFGTLDYGGGPEPVVGHAGHGSGVGGRSVSDLHGPRAGEADSRFELTARKGVVRLASGRTVDALTFNGTSPGPELRVRQGDLVEVELTNDDVEQGVTVHWHGVDVPNAEDGVAGVTQNAVLPGERYVYRFRAEQVGTFWYHTHQVSSKEVRRGLFGAFVIEPREPSSYDVDDVLIAHTFAGVPTLDGRDAVDERTVAPGSSVRYRLVNSDSTPHVFAVSGTPFRVLAIDGTDVNEPSLLERTTITVAGGGRADIGFGVPRTPVWLSLVDTGAAVALNARGRTSPLLTVPTVEFDAAGYGRPHATPFDASSSFDRRFELEIDRKPGFFDGRPGRQWAINGEIFPNVPTFVVEEGDLVEISIRNDTSAVHPMHLHGHHLLVLSKNGVAVSGSPWWVDTLNVLEDESYVVAFRADNPGIWMDHCHNLDHASEGLTMHVAYAGVTTPFQVGAAHHNQPE